MPLVLAALGATTSIAAEAGHDLELVSRATDGTPADSGAIGASLSDSGRIVVFDSDADNLSASDRNEFTNVFVRDLETGVTDLVSRTTGPGGAAADGRSFDPEVSADGRYVAFTSEADNLSGQDSDSVHDVFVRDLVKHTTTLASRRDQGSGLGGNGDSFDASLSADGRYLVFTSAATDISGEDDDRVLDVFVRDLKENTTTLVSRQSAADGGTRADDHSEYPAISGNGRYIAFESRADNLSPDDDNAVINVFVHDRIAKTTTLVSRRSDGGAADGDSEKPAISVDGSLVTFVSYADNLSDDDLDGEVSDTFVRDLRTGITTLFSRQSAAAGGAGADDASGGAAMTGDGRYLLFLSDGRNLSPDAGGASHVYLRDRLTLPVPAVPPTLPGTPAPAPGAPDAGDGVAPSIAALSLSNRAFAVARTARRAARRPGRRVGTRIRFTLSEPADARIAIARLRRGRAVSVGVLRRAGLPAGRNAIKFTGRIGRRALRPGRYRLTVVATDAAGNRSRPARTTFKVVRAARGARSGR